MSDVILTVNEPLYINIEKQNAQVIEGPAGQDGAPGKSAYELAVENGFVGTLQEWLESLEGASAALQFRNGLRLLAGDFVESGSDSEIDAKGSQLLANNYIHLNGYSKTFVGSKFGNPSLFTIGDDGGLRLNAFSTPGVANSRYPLKIRSLTSNIDFNFTQSTTPYPVSDNNVFMMGWNLSPGGGAEVAGKSAIGLSFEDNYEPSSGYDLSEKHLFFVDKAGIQHRLESYTIDKDTPATWEKYNTLAKSYIKNPADNNNVWHEFSIGGNGDIYEIFSSGGKSVRFLTQPSQNRFNIIPVGFHASIVNNTFDYSGFGEINNSAYQIAVFTSILTFKFKKPLYNHADNAAAITAGRAVGELYRDSNGFVRIVI